MLDQNVTVSFSVKNLHSFAIFILQYLFTVLIFEKSALILKPVQRKREEVTWFSEMNWKTIVINAEKSVNDRE